MAEGGVGGEEETGGCGDRRSAPPPAPLHQFATLGPSAQGSHLRDDRDISSQPNRRSETIQSYESDCESSSSSVESPEPPPPSMGAEGGTDLSVGPPKHRIEENNRLSPNGGAAAVAASTHLNGTMAGLVSLHQNLQNLASLQQSLPQVASLAAGLTNMASLTSAANSVVNAPLNLSVSAGAAASRGACATPVTGEPPPAPLQIGAVGPPTSGPPPQAPPTLLGAPPPPQPAPMPQLILAAGQLVQGIQGAQLLIPTSQGLATQTILTIPVNHVNSSDQMVNLALNNGQVMQTSLANLQAMAQSNLLGNPATNAPASAPNGTIAAPQPPPLLNPATITHLLANNSAQQQLLQQLPQMLGAPPQPPQPPLINPLLGAQQPQPPPPLMASPPPQQQPGAAQRPAAAGYAEPKLLRPLSRDTPPPRMASNGDAAKRSPQLSPSCDGGGSTADLLIDSPNQPTINQTSSNVVDGINLDEIKDFAKAFKLRRLSLGLTQTQVGQALSVTEGPAYSQSAICRFEKLDITPKSAQKIKPVLERWMKEAEERYKSGQNHLTDFIGIEPSKKRKRRTSFTPQALELLNAHFERNTHPSGTEITGLAHQLGYEREVIRIWFCNKRQALKNTVRMMSKGMV